MNTTKIMFKGDKLGIKIIIDKDLTFDEAKSILEKKARDTKKIFGNTDTGITFIGKELTDEETKILLDILCKECELNVTFSVDETYVSKFLSNSTPNKVVPEMESVKDVSNVTQVFSENENITLYHKGSLRSGASIKHGGSVVVYGDINAGAEVIAEGNVIVLGNAKGLIQAGCTGNKKCFVFSLNLLPTQLRIGEIIAFVPKDDKRKKGLFKPQIAYVDDGKIFVSEI